MFTPTPSDDHPGHYKTWLENLFEDHDLKKPMLGLDIGCPSIDEVSSCPRGCSYVFTSKADCDKHDILMHLAEHKADQQRKQRAQKRSANHLDSDTKFQCDYANCGQIFKTQPGLRRHQHCQKHFC